MKIHFIDINNQKNLCNYKKTGEGVIVPDQVNCQICKLKLRRGVTQFRKYLKKQDCLTQT